MGKKSEGKKPEGKKTEEQKPAEKKPSQTKPEETKPEPRYVPGYGYVEPKTSSRRKKNITTTDTSNEAGP